VKSAQLYITQVFEETRAILAVLTTVITGLLLWHQKPVPDWWVVTYTSTIIAAFTKKPSQNGGAGNGVNS
jgi:hypothetical protein